MLGGIVKILLIFAVFTGAVYLWNPSLIERAIFACNRPVTYSLGSFDERFGITREDFLSALAEAEEIWEESVAINLFSHIPEGGQVSVNLIYDYRQDTTNELQELEEEVEESEAAFNSLRIQYESLISEYEREADGYEERVNLFNERSAAYQARVEAWNRGDRRSEAEFQSLENERRALEEGFGELEESKGELDAMVGGINSLVSRLNRLARILNLNVERYNTVGATRGETFTGGVYYSEGGKSAVDIYEFSNREKLVRILAHEMGHALGLEHVEDSESIMYYLNQSEELDLSDSDLEVLRIYCRLD